MKKKKQTHPNKQSKTSINKWLFNFYKNKIRQNFYKIIITCLILLIILNKNGIAGLLFNFGISEYSLIREYIETFLSWPVISLIISLYVITKFSESIKIFLENVKTFKAGSLEMTTQSRSPQQEVTSVEVKDELKEKGITLSNDQIQTIENEFDKVVKEKQNIEQEVGTQKETINYLAVKAELYEFAYLNLYFVPNTKNVLLWFNSQNSCTHQYFIYNYQLPSVIINPDAEKEAIFNALITNQLLDHDLSLIKINDKGKRFLKFIGYIN